MSRSKPSFNIINFPISGLTDPEKCATAYVALLYYGCIEELEEGIPPDSEPEMCVHQVQEGETPMFWGVYGRNADGTSEWIADFGNEIYAMMFVAQLARVLGTPIEGEILNLQPLEAAAYMMNNKGAVN